MKKTFKVVAFFPDDNKTRDTGAIGDIDSLIKLLISAKFKRISDNDWVDSLGQHFKIVEGRK